MTAIDGLYVISAEHWHNEFSMKVEIREGVIIEARLLEKGSSLSNDGPPQQVLEYLLCLFMFTGSGPNQLVVQNEDAKRSWIILKKLYAYVYALPIHTADSFDFLSLSTCGCNMGHCTRIIGVELVDKGTTCGSVIGLWGFESKQSAIVEGGDEISFFEHPDSAYLYTDEISEIPLVYEDCYNDRVAEVQPEFAISAEKVYFSYSYGR